VRPNGQGQKSAIRAEAIPNGMVMIRTNITTATCQADIVRPGEGPVR
jgi:hypothetical protein